MIFTNDKPIYMQMADRLCDEILSGTYADDDRVPSIREYAVLLQVNINTAMKAYDELGRAEIIYNKRGLGYFVTPGAREKIMKSRRKGFLQQTLPELFRNMQLLQIDFQDIEKEWHTYSHTAPSVGSRPNA
ncbi:MAG: GntR family transcriptional regulator [Prevotella sp.]|nr:GntR family transcriptional regulator [Prevotella sp.]